MTGPEQDAPSVRSRGRRGTWSVLRGAVGGALGDRRRGRPGLTVVVAVRADEVAAATSFVSALTTVLGDPAAGASDPGRVEVVLAPWRPPVPAEAVDRGAEDDSTTCVALSALSTADAPVPVRVAPVAASGNAARNAALAGVRAPFVLMADTRTRWRAEALGRMLAAARSEPTRIVRATPAGNPFDPASYVFPAAYLRDPVVALDENHGDRADALGARAAATDPVLVAGPAWDRVPASGGLQGSAEAADADWPDAVGPWLRMVPTVRQLAPEPEKAAWVRSVLTEDVPGLLHDVERLPYELLPELADTIGAVLAVLRGPDLAAVPVEARATAWLAGQARWGDLANALTARISHEGHFPTRVEGSRVYADLPGADWAALHTPPAMLEVGAGETPMRSSLRRVRWLRGTGGEHGAEGEALLALDVFVVVPHLSLAAPRIQARWVSDRGAVPLRVRPHPDPHVAVFSGSRYADHAAGSVTLVTTLADLAAGRWRLELAVTQNGVVRTGRLGTHDRAGSAGALRPAPDGRARPVWDEEGLRLDVDRPGTHRTTVPRGPLVRAVRVEDDWLAVDATAPLPEPVVLVAPGGTVPGEVDGSVARFWLRVSAFGRRRAAPCGRYRVFAGGAELAWDPTAEDATSYDLMTDEHRVGVRRSGSHGLVVDLRPPLRDDELGAYGQSRLLSGYDVHRPLADVVLLEADGGRACTGSPLAIDREVARSRPALRRVWAVADSSVLVPRGCERVLRHSRAWFELLATARLVVTDGDLPAFVTRRPGQLVLQTLTGYPARTMGVDVWKARSYTARQIDLLLTRGSRKWSALCAPSPRLEHFFRESFHYEGELLPFGLPRTDLLVGPEAAARGREQRERLGIDPAERVVFYAPEPGALPSPGSGLRDVLDVGALAEALGPSSTILLRDPAPGRMPVATRGARVVDVTDHPEVSDLMLAADVGVFDYSALRFDFALTGRPMVFQVPDASVRAGDTRGFLFPYFETAPGPVVVTAEEIAEELDDLDDLARRTAEPLARFNAEFNDMADGRVAQRVVNELFGPRFGQAGVGLAQARPEPPDPGPRYRVVR